MREVMRADGLRLHMVAYFCCFACLVHNQAAFWGFTYGSIPLICARNNLQSAIALGVGLLRSVLQERNYTATKSVLRCYICLAILRAPYVIWHMVVLGWIVVPAHGACSPR
jgi:hypothetical protein